MACPLKANLVADYPGIPQAAGNFAEGSDSTAQERVVLPVTHVVQSVYSHWPHKRTGINPLQQAHPG